MNDDDAVKAAAQKQAEDAFNGFIKLSKVTLVASVGVLLIVASCNFGVTNDKYPGYNGEQYAPENLNNTGKD